MNRYAMDYRIDLYETIDDIDLIAWNSVRDAEDLYTDPRLMRAVEQSMSSVARFRYLLIRDSRNRPVAITPLCTYTIDGTVLATNRRFLNAAAFFRRFAPFLTRYRMLLCGLPFSGAQNHLRISAEVDPGEILSVLDRELSRIARHDRAQYFVIKEFDPESDHDVQGLTQLGYHQADSLPSNEMVIGHTDYDEYLKDLTKHRRHEIRRYARKLSAAGLRLITTSDTATIENLLTDDVYRLYLAVVEKSSTVFEILPLEFFKELTRQLPENCEFMFCLDELLTAVQNGGAGGVLRRLKLAAR
ncbi:MAG: peptidogalycan biosysnthesis protein, partial [Planctomycetota bacterium]|nr:peptidogalycan biosysnthesis protein [Planctomycetota bacterium]